MMLNPLSTADELKTYFAIGTPKIVVTIPPFVPQVRAANADVAILVLGEADGAEPLAALLGGSPTPPVVVTNADDVAVMPYSSGTTGFPEGVMLTHANIIAQCRSLAADRDSPVVLPDSNVLAVLPFFHIYGIMAFLTFGLTCGATIVTMPRFELEPYLALARQYEVRLPHVVPPILLGLAKDPGDLALPALESALTGAAALGAELAAELTKRTGARVFQVYGMTEVSGASHLGTVAEGRNKPGSIGALIANVEARIVAVEGGTDVGPGEHGEVWVRGPNVMKGYFGNDAATAETIDRDGWLHTGDIGFADEIPKAAVVLGKGASATADDLVQFVQARVNPQKRIRAVRFVEAIPKSASGKILRRVLLAEEAAARAASAEAAPNAGG